VTPQDGQGYVFRGLYSVGPDGGRRLDAAVAQALFAGPKDEANPISRPVETSMYSNVRNANSGGVGLLKMQ
jgi:hypothetical protein